MKKGLTWGAIAFLVFFIAYQPANAAQVFKSIGNGIKNVAIAFGDFFSSLIA